MIKITTEIEILAPIHICFDFARDITLHTRTVWPHTKERAIEGVQDGMIGEGEMVTFEATHFLVRQKLSSRITEYRRPYLFVDTMTRGAFKSLKHEHHFFDLEMSTVMQDTLILEAPLGLLGKIAERAVLKTYMTRFINYRNRELKKQIEQDWHSKHSGQW
ncbi:SRPBCC family protein [Paenibacillus dakarensis]|uniref:SRPBCC family protein n=1 Tax=Paenibacillus dakarensis TaxID=1527293 RepID=UPI0006D57724|nr:SRPBCC family protein [Paenibacillus dakarensis]